MKSNVFGLNRVVYTAMFVAAVMASAATFGTVVMGFEMHQNHVAQGTLVAMVGRA